MLFPWLLPTSTTPGHFAQALSLLEQQTVGSKLAHPLPMTLQPGQLVEGKVIQLLPHNTAWIQLGPFKVLAQLNIPLQQGQQEWFQVAQAAHPVILKVITSAKGEAPGHSANHKWTTLFQWLGVEDTSINRELVHQLSARQVALTPALFKQIQLALSQTGTGKMEIEAVLWATQKGWPPTPAVIRSLVTYWNHPDLAQLLNELKQSLPPEQAGLWQAVLNNLPIKDFSAQNLRQFLHQLQFDFKQTKPSTTVVEQSNITHLIHALLRDPALPGSVHKKAEQLLYYLAGQQLMLKGDTPGSPLAYLLFQFLVNHHHQQQTVYGKLKGYSDPKGKLDPQHCRLLLYVQPQHLDELCVDIFIQSKVISIKLYNNALPQEWLDHYKPILAKGLASQGYQLGSLQVKKWEALGERTNPNRKYGGGPRPYQGVDIRL